MLYRGEHFWGINYSVGDFFCLFRIVQCEGVRGRGLKSVRGMTPASKPEISLFFIRNGTTSPSFHVRGFSTCGLGRSKLFSPIKSSTFPYSLHQLAMRVNNCRGSYWIKTPEHAGWRSARRPLTEAPMWAETPEEKLFLHLISVFFFSNMTCPCAVLTRVITHNMHLNASSEWAEHLLRWP